MTPPFVAPRLRHFLTRILDLRSGARKSTTLPPKRPYRKREMVVHSPAKFEVRRPAEDGTATAGATPGTAAAAASTDAVPPSVAAAAAAAAVDQAASRAPDLGALDGVTPPAIEVQAEIHSDANVTTRAKRNNLTGNAAVDDDKISLADSISDAPPPPGSANHPPLNPFTPEWFAQMISAAATAAATAVASSPRHQAPSPASSAPAPRRLNERKVPDFWEDRPEFWFRIFDAHLSHFSPSEQRCFDALLPLLTPAARSTVHSVIRHPGAAPYSRAREALIRHFGRTPRQLAREAREARSLGDRLPSEFLDHLTGLLPDIKLFYEVALLDALPPNARVAAL